MTEEAGLRVSIAEIHAAAPFSTFTGRRRLLIVIGPVGIDLHLEGRRHHIGPGGNFHFDGDADVRVSATAEPTMVLNVIHDDRWTSTSAADDPEAGQLTEVLQQRDPQGEEALIALSGRGVAVRTRVAVRPGTALHSVVAALWLPVEDRFETPLL